MNLKPKWLVMITSVINIALVSILAIYVTNKPPAKNTNQVALNTTDTQSLISINIPIYAVSPSTPTQRLTALYKTIPN